MRAEKRCTEKGQRGTKGKKAEMRREGGGKETTKAEEVRESGGSGPGREGTEGGKEAEEGWKAGELVGWVLPKRGDACGEHEPGKRKNRYKRGRSKDSKSSLQSEDVMWTEPK